MKNLGCSFSLLSDLPSILYAHAGKNNLEEFVLVAAS